MKKRDGDARHATVVIVEKFIMMATILEKGETKNSSMNLLEKKFPKNLRNLFE